MKNQYKDILSPFTFPVSGVKIKNRIAMAPMTTFSGNSDGTVSDDEIAYYKHRNQSAELLITACAYVMPQGKGFHGQIGVHTNKMIPSLQLISTALHKNGGKAILQIFHGGRMSPPEELPDGQCLSASPVASLRDGAQLPREMTAKEIELTINAFADATKRAIEAGFDGVEIHGANTYLIQQFFSPHSNRRTDSWGGNLKNRMAFPLAVTDAVIASIKKYAQKPFIAGYRISPEEVENPGITIDDTLALVEVLSHKKLDYIHVSTMDFWSGSMRNKNDKVSRTQLIVDKVAKTIPVIGVGGVSTAEQAEKILATGVSLVAIGREILIDPNWIDKVKSGNILEIETALDLNNQSKLVIPTPMWERLLSRPGWIKVKK